MGGNEYPVGYTAVFCQRDGTKVGFSFEVIWLGECGAPRGGIEIPGCYFFVMGCVG